MPVLSCASLLAFWLLDFLTFQPNRIVPGTGFSPEAALGWPWALSMTVLLLFILAASFTSLRAKHTLQLLCVLLLLVQLPLSLAGFSATHVPDSLPHARTGIASGFWLLLFFAALMLIELQQKMHLSRLSITALLMLPLSCLIWVTYTGQIESLALVREYASRSSQFQDALQVHLLLVCGAVGFSLILGFVLVLLMRQWPAVQKFAFGLLNFIQTIPSLALFGLLIAPLGYLASRSEFLQAINVSGIGWAPALIALIAYSLLPIVRNVFIALEEVPDAVLESAKGMGMSQTQVFLQVRLPLAMPVMLEGVRITSIQAIGLTAVAALIGAGGLGSFIFQGLGQAAMDMILLGALPILVMALLADLFFSGLAGFFRYGAKQ
ncbi:ABC transporter permease [Nitrincola sp.]|uniref:ABC transporter permease n=1 Tax=Nitrincola sp. TaxID=1926584 RepID=UPI003A93F72A